MHLVRFLVLIVAAAHLSCAGTSVTPLNETTDKDARGFRYYESSPYILVYADGKGGLVTKLLYLPDQRKLRSIKPWEFLAENTTKLKFSSGVLTEAELDGDGTKLPKAAVEALKTVASAAAGAIGFRKVKARADGTLEVPMPQLFRVKFENGALSLDRAESDVDYVLVRPGIEVPR